MQAALRVALLLVATVGPPWVAADGNVGCLYSKVLCEAEEEWCYDDLAFGRCIANAGVDEDDLYRYDLTSDELHEFSRELRRLFTLGYRWSHVYTQCQLQAMLYAVKNELSFELDTCTHLADQDLEAALRVLESQDEISPEAVAIVKYTPSADNPHADFADEVYFPPGRDSNDIQAARDIILPSNAVDVLDMEDPYVHYEYPEVVKRSWAPPMRRSPPAFSYNYNTPRGFRQGEETKDEPDQAFPLDDNLFPFVEFLNSLRLSPYDVEYLLRSENADELRALVEQFADNEVSLKDMIDELVTENEEIPARFTVGYNTPERFRAGWELRDAAAVPPPPVDEDYQESRVYFDENEPEFLGHDEEYGSGHQKAEIFRELKNSPQYVENQSENEIPNDNVNGGIYTEGGVVHVPGQSKIGDQKMDTESLKQDFNVLLDRYNMGFKRPERLDVKKPGPQFATTDTPGPFVTQETGNDILKSIIPSMMKKEPRGAAGHPDPLHDLYDDVDTDYVYVGFKDSIRTWKEGSDIIRNISSMLHLEPRALTHVRVDRKEVTFRVGPNLQELNASQVARKIELIKDRLKDVMGVEVTSAGIGDKIKMPTVLSVQDNRSEEIYVMIILLCGVMGATILAVGALLLIRKHMISRQKLHGLTRPDTEASKDYQELCRARMAAKSQPAAGAAGGEHGRITSLSRESEQSPSSRSSTSSWSEEPALHNMDISTGHMVLSYMEDHLKNKDRLDQEWVALCAYEAEPCATTIALNKDNVEKNRYKDILPYDHARVVLNDLSNISGGDYINASSITDHDPRNPAYIAAQGPLPNTAPDFWQLIWEQGAVVIVMLTRLTEGGAAMCHRYWPEEGSELYHVYEVHLVSEHIWCDDYLVRSFYLKNARTGETRTVTQFHFLSWPEGGVPASTKALLEFRRKVNKSYRGRSCPIVVHCSDGVGRTGTYCLIDMVLSRMAKGAKEIDIAATLEHLRDQRSRMVTSKQQFEFVLTAVAEEVHAILKALPPQPVQPAVQHTEKP